MILNLYELSQAGPFELGDLVETVAFSLDPRSKSAAFRLIRTRAMEGGAYPASLRPVYDAFARGEISNVTMPAFNIRGITFEIARSIFRVARKLRAAAFLFELARSEIEYTDQTPSEYAGCVLAAALAEKHAGPVFLQGDHFQFHRKRFEENPEGETEALRRLVRQALEAGFFNIDIDASTLVDLSRPTIAEQQERNVDRTAEMVRFVTELGAGKVAIGGEIGEVGKKNSTVEEFRAFAGGLKQRLGGNPGICKVSVQTGTRHGGQVRPDGTVGKMAVDLSVHESISAVARKEFGLAGTVQHGASTLPLEMFDRFPGSGCVEIHLATELQNLLFRAMPPALRESIDAWIQRHLSKEFSPSDTLEQNLYRTRKKSFGPFKREFWAIPRKSWQPELEKYVETLFVKLNVVDTAPLVARFVQP